MDFLLDPLLQKLFHSSCNNCGNIEGRSFKLLPKNPVLKLCLNKKKPPSLRRAEVCRASTTPAQCNCFDLSYIPEPQIVITGNSRSAIGFSDVPIVIKTGESFQDL